MRPERDDAASTPGLVRASVACAATFLALAVVVTVGSAWLDSLDERMSARAYAFTLDHPWCEAIARVATFLGNGQTVTAVTAVVAVMCAWRRRWLLAGWLVVTVGGGALLGTAVKVSVERIRPGSAGVLTSAQGFSFPSGHARGATIAYVAVFLVVAWQVFRPGRRSRVASAAAVTAVVGAVGLSRVFLGAHWPSDVLGGWLLGSAWVMAATAVLLRMTRSDRPGPR